jgi:hypothetical protein
MAGDLEATRYRDGSAIGSTIGDTVAKKVTYGWSSVSDPRGLCPAGWHVPSNVEWASLFNSLGGQSAAGKKLEAGFTDGNPSGQWWSSTENSPGEAISFFYDNRTVGVIFCVVAKQSVLTVRCIRDN